MAVQRYPDFVMKAAADEVFTGFGFHPRVGKPNNAPIRGGSFEIIAGRDDSIPVTWPTFTEQGPSFTGSFTIRTQPSQSPPVPAAPGARARDDLVRHHEDEIERVADQLRSVRADILADRLDRAVTALVNCRLSTRQGELDQMRQVLFELYDDEIITRMQVCERGDINAADFFDLLDDYRQHGQ